MRILLVHMQFGRTYTQGGERYVATLAAGLRKRGHDVGIIAGDPLQLDKPRAFGEIIDEREQLYAYPTRGWMAVEGVASRELHSFLQTWQPDVIHLNTAAHIGVGIALAAKELKIPLVVTAHDFWWTCPKGTLLRGDGEICDGTPEWSQCVRCIAADHRSGGVRSLAHLPAIISPVLLGMSYIKASARGMSWSDMRRWPARRRILLDVLSMADAVICPSRTILETLAGSKASERWHVIRNGIGSSWFAEGRPNAGCIKSPEELVIGFAGALAPHKGPHLLLEAVKSLGWHRTLLRIAGPETVPAYAEKLRHLADGMNVEFAGNLPAEAMKEFLRSLDVLAMTSRWLENCPYIVLEAQAAGVNVVGPARGGVAELIEDPGLQYHMGSSSALAGALTYARTHPVSTGPIHVPTEEQMTDATEAVYRCVATSTP